MSRTFLVTGASGYLGRVVARHALAAGWHVAGTYLHAPADVPGVQWHQLDVRDHGAVHDLFAQVQPALVLHVAVVEPSDWTTNADGAAYVALAALRSNARLIHMSSDAIFDGSRGRYTEADPPQPITSYGAAKAAAETLVRILAPHALIVRTSLIIGARPYKHVQMVLDLLTGRREGVLFSDEIRCPIWVDDVAAALLELAVCDTSGILHVAGADAVSRYELGVLLAQHWGLDGARLRAGSVAASGVQRPTDVRLDCSRAHALLRTPLRGVRTFLKRKA